MSCGWRPTGADQTRLLGDWTEDTSTGRLFKDFPLELTGSDTEIGQEIEVIENGAEENDWSYWASIRILEDWEGNTLTGAEEAEYWTVKQGFRETTIDATDSGGDTGTVVLGTIQTEVYEGAEVVFTLTRFGGPMGEAMKVKVKTRERNRPAGNPIHRGCLLLCNLQTVAKHSHPERIGICGRREARGKWRHLGSGDHMMSAAGYRGENTE